MSEKHYNAAYLSDTAQILKGIKLRSYEFFEELEAGTVVDLGCGTGMDVHHMAAMFGARFKTVGVDHDASLIEIARKNAPEGANLEFHVAEGDRLPFADSCIQGLRAERLVQHLKTPATVYAEMHRILVPGAAAVIVESDWSSLHFYHSEVATTRKLVTFLTESKINNGYAAPRLIQYFSEAGFKDISLQIFPFVLTKLQDAFTYLWIDKMLSEMVELKLLSVEEQEKFIRTVETMDQNGCFACSMNIVIAAARRK